MADGRNANEKISIRMPVDMGQPLPRQAPSSFAPSSSGPAAADNVSGRGNVSYHLLHLLSPGTGRGLLTIDEPPPTLEEGQPFLAVVDELTKTARSDFSTWQKTASQPTRFLACPFRARDPTQHVACLKNAALRDPHDVKRHLWRVHRLPNYCPACYAVFDKASECTTHIVQRTFICFLLLAAQRGVNLLLPYQIGKAADRLAGTGPNGDVAGLRIVDVPWLSYQNVLILMMMAYVALRT